MSNTVSKQELLKIAEILFREAYNANSYYLIMQQYRKYSDEYKAELNLSPAFYNTVRRALNVACFMELAKLYDKASGTFTIGSLLKECKNNISLFPEYRIFTWTEDGKEHTLEIPFQHELKPDEEQFIEERILSQRKILKLFDAGNTKETVVIDLKFTEYLSLLEKKYESLSEKLERIRKRRNKVYAHNDRSRLLGEDISTQDPVLYSDIQELTDFALDVTQLIIVCFTNTYIEGQCSNIDDWESTLKLTKIGLEYKDDYINQQIKELEKTVQFQIKE